MGNADSVVAQKRLARFRPDERPVIEGIFDRLHGTGSSVSSGTSGKVLSLDMLKMTMGKMASESVIKRVFQGIHSIDPEVPLPPGDRISREQLVIFLADILRGTAEERAPLVLAMAEGAKATATTTEQIRGFMEDLVSATVQTLAHRGHLRAWQPDHMGDETQGVTLLAEQLTSELKSSDQNTCDIPCLEDWLFRIPAMSMFLELLIAESLGAGLPSCPPPTLLPLCQYAPWSDFRCLLNIPLLMFLSPQLPGGHSAPWSLLFSTNIHGESFTRLVGNCKSQGPTVMLVKDTKGHIFGGFVSQSWEVKPQFQGDSRCFLFSVFPYMRVFTCTGYNDHYLYLNQGQHTMPNAFHFTRNKLMDWSRVNYWIIVMFLSAVWTLILTAPIHCRGSMGMGGQHGYFGLWLDYDFGHGHSRARPCCTTYGSPQLSGDEDFKLDTVEVWGVGQPPEEQEKDEEKKKSILDVDPDAQAMMEMIGKTLYSQILREPEEDEEQ